MGILHVMVSKLKGARVIVSEISEERRKIALELGADTTINPQGCDTISKVKNLLMEKEQMLFLIHQLYLP